jgi:hypothetical protein
MSSRLIGSTAAIALVAFVPVARAQQPTFTYADDKAKEEVVKLDHVEWKAAAQAGLLITAGNSRMTAISAGLNASRLSGRNKLQIEGGVAYGRSSVFLAVDGNGNGVVDEPEVSRPSTTTNRGWTSKARYDRFLTDHDSLYGAALAAADEPAGKEFVGGGQLGYSRLAFKSPAHAVMAEAGYDLSYENPVVGDGHAIHSLRVFAGYAGKLDGSTSLDAAVEALFNVNTYDGPAGELEAFDDTRVTSRAALTTTMFSDVSFRFAVESKFDNAPSPRPPFAVPYAPGFVPLADELDTKVEASLIVNFL